MSIINWELHQKLNKNNVINTEYKYMKREKPLKRPKRKKDHLVMVTWNDVTYESVNMPAYLADEYVRYFDLTKVPTTSELRLWIEQHKRK